MDGWMDGRRDGWMMDGHGKSTIAFEHWVFIMLQPPASVSCSSAISVQLSGFSSFSQISRLPFPHWGNVRVRMHYLSSVLKKKIGGGKKKKNGRSEASCPTAENVILALQ